MSRRQKPAFLARKSFASRDLYNETASIKMLHLKLNALPVEEKEKGFLGSDELDELARTRLSVNERNHSGANRNCQRRV